MSDIQLEGAEEINRKLKAIASVDARLGSKIQRPTIQAGATVLAREIRRSAPKGTMRRAVGSKVRKRRGQFTAKAGMNVGKKRNRRAPQAHLLTAGTKERRTKSGVRRGRVKPNHFVPQAARRSTKRAVGKMQGKLNEQIEKHVRG